jgi:hypothetical protein
MRTQGIIHNFLEEYVSKKFHKSFKISLFRLNLHGLLSNKPFSDLNRSHAQLQSGKCAILF